MSTGKGKKRVRNPPVLHGELKKPHGIMVTDTAWNFARIEASVCGISDSEYRENLLPEKRKETVG